MAQFAVGDKVKIKMCYLTEDRKKFRGELTVVANGAGVTRVRNRDGQALVITNPDQLYKV